MKLLEIIKSERESFAEQIVEHRRKYAHNGPPEFFLILNQPYLGTFACACSIAIFIVITALTWVSRGIGDPIAIYNATFPSLVECLLLDGILHILLLFMVGAAIAYLANNEYLLMKLHLGIMGYTMFRLAWLLWLPTTMGPEMIVLFLSFNTVMIWVTGTTLLYIVSIFAGVVVVLFFCYLPLSILYNLVLGSALFCKLWWCDKPSETTTQEFVHTFPAQDTSVVEEQ